MTAADRLTTRMAALKARLVGEADAAGASEVAKGTPLTTWLSRDGSRSSRDAAAEIFAARDLNGNAAVQEAVGAGRLTVGQARAVASTLAELPETLSERQRAEAERLMVEQAARRDPRRMRRLGDEVVAQVAPAAQADARAAEVARLERQHRRAVRDRGLTFVPNGEGSVLIRGSLPVSVAAPVEKAIEALVEADRRAGRDRALDRLDPRAEARTPAQRRADALCALVAGWVKRNRQVSRVAGDRPRVVVTMREADLRKRAEQAGVLDSGTHISAGELRRMLCDADLMPVVLGGDSEILDVGRAQRLVSPAIRRVLAERDQGCQFPGCAKPGAECEAHHIVPWWAGGVTALSNLVLLCPHHHGLVEPDRFSGDRPPDQRPDRWEVRMDEHGFPEFLPPLRMDPARTPRPGTSRLARSRQ